MSAAAVGAPFEVKAVQFIRGGGGYETRPFIEGRIQLRTEWCPECLDTAVCEKVEQLIAAGHRYGRTSDPEHPEWRARRYE